MEQRGEYLYQTFLAQTHNGLILKVQGSSFFVFAVGDAYLKLSGQSRPALVGKNITEIPQRLLHPSTAQVLEGMLKHKNKTTIIPHQLQELANNQSTLVSVDVAPVLDLQGEVAYILYTVVEIGTYIKKAEKNVNQNYFMELMDQAPVGVCILRGPEMIFESANVMMLELLGKTCAIIDLPLRVALPEFEGQSFFKLLDDAYTWGEPLVGNEVSAFLVRNSKLEKGYFNFVYQPLKNNLGETYAMMMVATEVTPLVLVKQQLEASVSNFKSVVMNAHYALLVLKGNDWLVEIANQPMLKLWDKKKEEVIGFPLIKILPELMGQPFPKHLQTVMQSGQSHAINEEVFYYNSSTGITKKYVSYFYDPMLDKEGNVSGIIVGAEDITERVENRLKIERAEEMLRVAVESANLGTWHFDPVSHRLNVSPRLKELFGYQVDEEILYKSAIAQVTEEHRFMVLKAVRSSVANGEQLNVEFSITGRHDKKLKWMHATGRIYRDNEGVPIRFSGVLMDITEQKQDEIRKNDFIAMVSHELKTPLTSLKAYVQLLGFKAKESNDAFTIKSLQKIEGQVNKMNKMIRSFLDLSRLEAGKLILEKEEFKLFDLIKEVVEDISLTDKTHIISIHVDESISVYADREKIAQVVNNLIGNAIKYSPQGTKVKIGCEQIADMLQVWIDDEGVGIEEKDLDKLFTRFFRVANSPLKTTSGFGIGLYLSAEIIKRHQGNIWVKGKEDKGSIFYFSLPRSTV